MASGIDCEETELDRALEEINDKEQASESSRKEGSSAQVKKDKEAAEEQRLKAVERLGQTTKRQVEADGKEMKPKKSRSGSETLGYLRDKFQSESQYKKEKLALRVKEQESRDAQQKIMVEQQRQMQQQQNELLKIMQKQQAKQGEQLRSFQMLFLQQQQQQQSQIQMFLLDKKNT